MLKEGEDFYFIDGGYIVFTTEYHLKRGFCCKNNCRHCPWKKSDKNETKTNKTDKNRL